MRRVIFGLCLLTLLGCSGLTSLVVINRTGGEADVRLKTYEPGERNRRKEEEKNLVLDKGDRKAPVAWFATPPEQIDLEATWSGRTIKKSWKSPEYPPAMARGSSGGGFYVLEIRPDDAVIREPSQIDRFIYNPGPYLGFACPGLIVLAVIIWRHRRRQAQPPVA